MSDDGHSETTTCDGCGKRRPWLQTCRWSIVDDKCYCEACTTCRYLNYRAGQVPPPKQYFVSDVNYQGDHYHD